MKALMYLGIGELEVQNADMPEEDFIVKILGCGICGTDLKTFLKGHHFFTPPVILGHEFYGEVYKTPGNCSFKQGDIVVVAPYCECGECEICRKNCGQLCTNKKFINSGAFCEYIGIPADYADNGVFKVSKASDKYTLVEPLACVLNGAEHLKVNALSKVLVVGSGPMGALFALLFKTREIPVAVVEPSQARREKVISWGIECYEPGKVDVSKYDNIVIAVNKAELVSQYAREIADAGTLLVFSGLKKEELLSIDSYAVHYREVSVTGSFGYAIRHFRHALDLLENRGEVFSKVITHYVPLEKGKESFELLQRAEAFKIVLKP